MSMPNLAGATDKLWLVFRRRLEGATICVEGNKIVLETTRSFQVTFDDLKALSMAFHTTKIDFFFNPEEFSIYITLDDDEKET